MEPARAGWSFNKWRKTKKLRRYQRLMRRHRNVHERAVALEVAEAPAAVVVVAAVDVAAQAAAELVVAVAPADRVVAADRAAAARVAKVVSAAADAVSARVATGKADAVTVAASSSRT